tara:strand:- start:365 stop:652 length:288 start_codon:yes stop_codon:yes gene_type:complete
MVKNKMIMILAILAMACIVWLIGENRAYKAMLNEQRIKEAELLDQFFDLQYEYERCLDGVFKAEYKLDTLMDYVGQSEFNSLFRDTVLNESYPIP